MCLLHFTSAQLRCVHFFLPSGIVFRVHPTTSLSATDPPFPPAASVSRGIAYAAVLSLALSVPMHCTTRPGAATAQPLLPPPQLWVYPTSSYECASRSRAPWVREFPRRVQAFRPCHKGGTLMMCIVWAACASERAPPICVCVCCKSIFPHAGVCV